MMNILSIKYFNIVLNYIICKLNKMLILIIIFKKYFNYFYQILLLVDKKINLIYKEINQYYKIVKYYKNMLLIYMIKKQIILYKLKIKYI